MDSSLHDPCFTRRALLSGFGTCDCGAGDADDDDLKDDLKDDPDDTDDTDDGVCIGGNGLTTGLTTG